MPCATTDHRPGNKFAHEPDLAMLFVSLELSKSKWLVTSLPAGGDKMSKHTISGGNWDALLSLLTELRRKAEARLGALPKIVSIHEACWGRTWPDSQDCHRRALARKLIVALWRFVTHGIVPEGAILKVA
jgi:hypothetical protein